MMRDAVGEDIKNRFRHFGNTALLMHYKTVSSSGFSACAGTSHDRTLIVEVKFNSGVSSLKMRPLLGQYDSNNNEFYWYFMQQDDIESTDIGGTTNYIIGL